MIGVKFENKSTGGLGAVTANTKDTKPLFITWILMGFWHGANWTFILWGLYHALIIFFYRFLKPISKNFSNKFVNFYGWIFRVANLMFEG